MNLLLAGQILFSILREKPTELLPPSIEDGATLFSAYEEVSGMDLGTAIGKLADSPNLKDDFHSFACTVAAIDTGLSDPAMLAKLRQLMKSAVAPTKVSGDLK